MKDFETYSKLSTLKRVDGMVEGTKKFISFYLEDYLKNYEIGYFEFMEYLVQKNVHPNTKATLARNLGKFFYWNRKITKEEFELIKKSFRPTRKTWSDKSLSFDDLDKFIRSASLSRCKYTAKRDMLIFGLFSAIGLRVSQLVDLLKEDVSTGEYITIKLTKKKENRDLRLNYDIKRIKPDTKIGDYFLADLINSYLEIQRGEYLFTNMKGEKITIGYVKKLVKETAKELGVKATTHTFRHHVCTRVANKYGILKAQILMGHADVKTTMRYINVEEMEISDAY